MADSEITELLLTLVPVAVYWGYSTIYIILAGPLEKYRLHSKKDEDKMNLVSMGTVIKGTLMLQFAQFAMNAIVFAVNREEGSTPSKEHSLPVLVVQFFVAMMVMDTWNYFVHRFIYHNKYLYHYIHSKHHQLVVTYSFGAYYASPIESIIDLAAYTLPILISGMSFRASIFFFSFTAMKIVDDHSGLIIPWNPFHILFTNTTAYHDIHHQLYGKKYNFGNPFFASWDKILGTHMPYRLEKKESGGFQVIPLKDRKGN